MGRPEQGAIQAIVVDLHEFTGRGSLVRLPPAQPLRGYVTPPLCGFVSFLDVLTQLISFAAAHTFPSGMSVLGDESLEHIC